MTVWKPIYTYRFIISLKNGFFPARFQRAPRFRRFAKDYAISVTTVETAYNQLLVEGYIESRPKSGYYVSDHIAEVVSDLKTEFKEESLESILPMDDS